MTRRGTASTAPERRASARWRWVFTINVPIGVALLAAIPPAVPCRSGPGPGRAGGRGLDVPDAVLVTAGTGAAIYGLINAGSHSWAAASALLPLVLAVVIWAIFALLERRVRRPLLAVGLLRWRAVPSRRSSGRRPAVRC